MIVSMQMGHFREVEALLKVLGVALVDEVPGMN